MINQNAHDWGDWVVTTPAKCEDKGVETRTCKRDSSHTGTREIAATGHKYIPEIIPPTYDRQGYTIYTCEYCDHSYNGNYVPALTSDPGVGGGGGGPGGGPSGPTATLSPSPRPTTTPSPRPTITPIPRPTGTTRPRPTNAPVTTNIGDDNIPGAPVFISDHISYIIGYPGGKIRPEANITRAEAVTVFYRLLTDRMRKDNWITTNDFPDVSQDAWYNTAVSVMTGIGVIKGHDDGNFAPDAPITRAELAAVVLRFARLMNLKANNGVEFNDIAGHWAAEDISYVSGLGWLAGYPDGTFLPDRPITRAEFMTVVNRMLKRVPESIDDMLIGEMLIWDDNLNPSAWYYLVIQEATNSHIADYKEEEVPNLGFAYERWVGYMGNPDWVALEAEWIANY